MTSKGYLIAETPRAGKQNHCFIIPEGCKLTSVELAQILSKGQTQPFSDQHAAISVENVAQVSGSRNGTETLIYYNSSPVFQTEPDRLSAEKFLKAHVKSLGQLVQTIEWDKHASQNKIERKELSEWQNEFEQSVLSSLTESILPDQQSESKSRYLIGAVGAAAFAISAFAFAVWFFSQSNEERVHTSPLDSKTISVDGTEQASTENTEFGEQPKSKSGEPANLSAPAKTEIFDLESVELSESQQRSFNTLFSNHEPSREYVTELCRQIAAVAKTPLEKGRDSTDDIQNRLLKLFYEIQKREQKFSQIKLTDDKETAKFLNQFLDLLTSQTANECFDSREEEGVPKLKDFAQANHDQLDQIIEDRGNIAESQYPAIRETAQLILLVADRKQTATAD